MHRFKFNPNQIHWFDGMPLLSQHMQHMQHSLQMSQAYIQSYMQCYMHGVLDIGIDLSILENNMIKLQYIECILQDGSLVFAPYTQSEGIEFKIETASAEDEYIYLCVHKEHVLGQRYTVAEVESVVDIGDSDNVANIMTLAYKPFLSSTKSESYFCIPILKYQFIAGVCQILSYDPPTVAIKNAKLTYEMLSNMVMNMKSLLQNIFINDKVYSKDNLHHINVYAKALSKLEHSLQVDIMHPMHIYSIMIDLCIDLSDNALDYTQCLDSKYDHENLYDMFSKICNFVNKKIDTDKAKYSVISYKFDLRDGKFSLTMPNQYAEYQDIHVRMLFPKSAKFETWIQNAMITDNKNMLNHYCKRNYGFDRKIVSINSTNHQYHNVYLKIILNQYINDIILMNDLDSSDSPNEIYLDWNGNE